MDLEQVSLVVKITRKIKKFLKQLSSIIEEKISRRPQVENIKFIVAFNNFRLLNSGQILEFEGANDLVPFLKTLDEDEGGWGFRIESNNPKISCPIAKPEDIFGHLQLAINQTDSITIENMRRQFSRPYGTITLQIEPETHLSLDFLQTNYPKFNLN